MRGGSLIFWGTLAGAGALSCELKFVPKPDDETGGTSASAGGSDNAGGRAWGGEGGDRPGGAAGHSSGGDEDGAGGSEGPAGGGQVALTGGTGSVGGGSGDGGTSAGGGSSDGGSPGAGGNSFECSNPQADCTLETVGCLADVAGDPENVGVISAKVPALDARFTEIRGIARLSNAIYLTHQHQVVALNIDSNEVSRVAGSPQGSSGNANGASGTFNDPRGIDIDAAGEPVAYVADRGNRSIRVVALAEQGYVTTLVSHQEFLGLEGLIVGKDTANQNAKVLFVADAIAHTVYKIPLTTKVPTVIAGTAGAAGDDQDHLRAPSGVAQVGGLLYVTEAEGNRVRALDLTTGELSVAWGSADSDSGFAEGMGEQARLSGPTGLAVSILGELFVSDAGNSVIRSAEAGASLTVRLGVPGYGGHRVGVGCGIGLGSGGPIYATSIQANGPLELFVGDGSVLRRVRL
jgi:hypothetical protein